MTRTLTTHVETTVQRSRKRTNQRAVAMEHLRNLGVAAHVDAGKTTLTERMLFLSGAIRHVGDVHTGDTTTDSDDIERRKGITINSAAVSTNWTPKADAGRVKPGAGITYRLNVIDTPGHVDFTAEVERSLRVLDGLIVVLCAVGRVQPQTETVWRQANRYRVPRMVFVNKMDRAGADFEAAVQDVRTKLGAVAAPVLVPMVTDDEVGDVIDVVNQRLLSFDGQPDEQYVVRELPEHLVAQAREAREQLVAALAEVDPLVEERFLSDQPVAADELFAALRRQTVAGRFVPVAGGSAYKHVGVPPLLDLVVALLPSPADVAQVEGVDPVSLEPVARATSNEAAACALAFKVVTDPHVGRVVLLRVYSGTLSSGEPMLNPRTGKRVRIGRLLQVFADQRHSVESAHAGDIVAAVGLGDTLTGDTLCAVGEGIQLEPPSFAEPVMSVAVEPGSLAERDAFSAALHALAVEDPTLRVTTDEETSQTLLAGMGELHLEVALTRLREVHGVEVQAGEPKTSFRETVSAFGKGDFKVDHQTGGPGMFARVVLEVSPQERGAGIAIENKVVGGAIPKEFIAACHKGVEEALREGVLAGYPVTDVRVVLLDGASHSEDSNELAFRMAARGAVREAAAQATPVLLEPIMRVQCHTPADYQGAMLGELTRRRARIGETAVQANDVVVVAHAPLAAMFRYAVAIRSLSQGRATFVMEPSHFDVVPAGLVDELLG